MKKQALIRLGIVLGVVCAVLVCWAATEPPALEEPKTLSVYIYDEDGNYTEHELETKARYLRQAMDEAGLLTLKETYGGTVITAVEDMTPAEGMCWVYNVNSEYSFLSVDEQPIEDEDMVSFYQLDLSAVPPEGSISWESVIQGTWESVTGEVIEITDYRVRLVGVSNLPYELSYDTDGDGVYLILDGDGAALGDYTRLVCRIVDDVPTLYARNDSSETALYKAE